jgi:hypothetical protein
VEVELEAAEPVAGVTQAVGTQTGIRFRFPNRYINAILQNEPARNIPPGSLHWNAR